MAQVTDEEKSAFLERRYLRNPDMVSRQIGDEFILVPIRRDVADLESIYTLSGTGVRIWELLDGERTGRDVRNKIVEEFEVESQEAEADLIELLQQLLEINGVLVAEER